MFWYVTYLPSCCIQLYKLFRIVWNSSRANSENYKKKTGKVQFIQELKYTQYLLPFTHTPFFPELKVADIYTNFIRNFYAIGKTID